MAFSPVQLGALSLGLILAVGWGPLSLPLPGLQHISIKDVPEEVFEGEAMELEVCL